MNLTPLSFVLLFALASAGHAILVIASHNWWYGSGLHRRAVDALQALHALLMLAGPVAFALLWGADWPPSGALAAVAVYGGLCCLVVSYFAGLTVWRLLRPRPAVLESNHTRTVDVARELGYQPV